MSGPGPGKRLDWTTHQAARQSRRLFRSAGPGSRPTRIPRRAATGVPPGRGTAASGPATRISYRVAVRSRPDAVFRPVPAPGHGPALLRHRALPCPGRTRPTRQPLGPVQRWALQIRAALPAPPPPYPAPQLNPRSLASASRPCLLLPSGCPLTPVPRPLSPLGTPILAAPGRGRPSTFRGGGRASSRLQPARNGALVSVAAAAALKLARLCGRR
jgi:hypothetical protein